MEFLSKYFDATKPYAFFEFSCGHYKSMDDLFVEMAYVLSFPDYFWLGNRWDSLNDCMQDLGWIDEEFISIRFSDFFVMGSNLPSDEKKDMEIFLDTIKFIVDHSHNARPTYKLFKIVID